MIYFAKTPSLDSSPVNGASSIFPPSTGISKVFFNG
ncbi:MAG TPA: hypothetical protein [Caudoviricetes sp.]|nr:MAG TPA: hypothetical protein [Caudoviricetes sp.]